MVQFARQLDFLWGKYLNRKHRSPFQSLPLISVLIFLQEADINLEKYAREKIKTHEESEKLLSPSPR